MKKDCLKYKNIILIEGSSCEDKYKEGTVDFIKCELCWAYYWIYNGLNEGINDVSLYDIEYYFLIKDISKRGIYSIKQAILEGKLREDIEYLYNVIDMIGDMLKKRQVNTELFEIEEYKEPKKVIRRVGKRERVEYWEYGYKRTEIDPCKIEDDRELERVVEDYKKKMKETLIQVKKKYGEEALKSLLDIVMIWRSRCYKGEIDID